MVAVNQTRRYGQKSKEGICKQHHHLRVFEQQRGNRHVFNYAMIEATPLQFVNFIILRKFE